MKPVKSNKTCKSLLLNAGLQMFAVTLIILGALSFSPAWSQEYQKENKKFYKSYYRKQTTLFANACNILERKHNKLPRRSIFAGNYKIKPRPKAEISSSPAIVHMADAKPQSKPTPPAPKAA